MRYLMHSRLQLAARQLKDSDGPIKLVMGRAGCESAAAFSRACQRRFGLSPGDRRSRLHGA
jgi:transcriptional regulator GlxA family with amidase domain